MEITKGRVKQVFIFLYCYETTKDKFQVNSNENKMKFTHFKTALPFAPPWIDQETSSLLIFLGG